MPFKDPVEIQGGEKHTYYFLSFLKCPFQHRIKLIINKYINKSIIKYISALIYLIIKINSLFENSEK